MKEPPLEKKNFDSWLVKGELFEKKKASRKRERWQSHHWEIQRCGETWKKRWGKKAGFRRWSRVQFLSLETPQLHQIFSFLKSWLHRSKGRERAPLCWTFSLLEKAPHSSEKRETIKKQDRQPHQEKKNEKGDRKGGFSFFDRWVQDW